LFVVLATLIGVLPACTPAPTARVSPPVVLFSDWGTDDYRVSRIKGVIYSAFADARITDGAHDIPAYDVFSAAYILGVAAREFPKGTVFISGVVPRTGPVEPQYIVAVTKSGQFLVAPDNGTAYAMAREPGISAVYRISNEKLLGMPLKNAGLHIILGRIGGLLAGGLDPGEAGPALPGVKLLDLPDASLEGGRASGTVIFVDHFGSCVTNLPGALAEKMGLKPADTVTLSTPGGRQMMKFGTGYGSVPEGDPIVFVHSVGTFQLSVNQGSFAKTYGLSAGQKFTLEKYAGPAASPVLGQLQQSVQGALDGMARDLSASAGKLVGVSLSGPEAHTVLADLYGRYPGVVEDVVAVDATGRIVAAEPQAYRSAEGADISAQPHIIQLHKTLKPGLSAVFRAVEGFEAVVVQQPVFRPDGVLAGNISLVVRPDRFLAVMMLGKTEGTSLEAWAMDLDGTVLWDKDANQIGRNSFLDPLYAAFPQVQALCRQIVSSRNGNGSYEFLATGRALPVRKDAVWTTVSLYGTEWRVVVAQAAA
jgi:S-adenosylmethionine hydrolase